VTGVALLLTVVSSVNSGADVPTVVFLALLAAGVMANAERLGAAAQARALSLQAGGRLQSAGRQQPDRPVPGPRFRVTYDDSGLTVTGYWLPDAAGGAGRFIDFTVAPGHTLIVTGPSGSGKTTLLNAIAAALREPGNLPAPDVVTAVLADDYLFTGTVASNVRLAGPAATDGEIRHLLTAMMLDRSGIDPGARIGTGGRHLSGGEQRRLHIARALATRPGLLLIDEPTSGLDRATATHVLAAMRGWLLQAVLALAMHEPPADPGALSAGWAKVTLEAGCTPKI
jgi:ATP-binding cassette subfamily C protein CydC